MSRLHLKHSCCLKRTIQRKAVPAPAFVRLFDDVKTVFIQTLLEQFVLVTLLHLLPYLLYIDSQSRAERTVLSAALVGMGKGTLILQLFYISLTIVLAALLSRCTSAWPAGQQIDLGCARQRKGECPKTKARRYASLPYGERYTRNAPLMSWVQFDSSLCRLLRRPPPFTVYWWQAGDA